MRTIWKYPLEEQVNTLDMPKGTEVLSVDNQREIPCLWAMGDPIASREQRTFVIHGTGHNIDVKEDVTLKFIGTVLMDNGQFVWHIFEVIT